ncbi:MAG: hypothetical protein NZ930_05565 [Candidatus Bipolaricaulota bacterium]|nr:hypothetical protein [Candidatus Bipolaricaulota bacterium]MDW8031725.1 hypothetical protein [Candidatus Bipolaricaulota bacterium]
MERRRGLTYGRLLVVMGAAIALALVIAFVQSLLLADQLSFDEIAFSMLQGAPYDKTELTRAELDHHNGDTGKIQGTVIYVKTSEGNYAKLAVEFGYRFWSPQLQFVVYQGRVYDRRGKELRTLYNVYVPLSASYDVDAGLMDTEGASERGLDLAFEERGPAEQTLRARNGAAFYLPKAEELRRQN